MPLATKFSQVPLIEVLNRLGYTPNSNNMICCIAPDHHEHTPSCQINSQVLYCYGCNQKWNAIQVIETVLQCNTEAAKDWYSVHMLGEVLDGWKEKQYQYKPIERKPLPKEREVTKPSDYQEQLERLVSLAGTSERLRQATNYLRERGLDGSQEVYLAPSTFDAKWLYPLKDRLLIPYRSFDGNLLHFQGRSFGNDKEKKYNYHNLFGGGVAIYGLETINDKTTTIVLAEGALTAMAIRQAMKKKKEIAVVGASSKNQKVSQVMEILHKFKHIKEVVLFPDYDVAAERTGLQQFLLLGREILDQIPNKAVKVTIIKAIQGKHKDALDLLKAEGERAIQAVYKTKARIMSSDEEQHKVRDKYKLVDKISSPEQLYDLVIEAKNTPYHHNSRAIEQLKFVMECIRYNPIKQDYDYFEPIKVSKDDLSYFEASRYVSSNGIVLIPSEYSVWTAMLSKAVFACGYVVIRDATVDKFLGARDTIELLKVSPLHEHEKQFSTQEERKAWLDERNPLAQVLSHFRFMDDERAAKVLDIQLRFQWLSIHRMLDKRWATRELVFDFIPTFVGEQGSGKNRLFKILSYAHVDNGLSGLLRNPQDSNQTIEDSIGKFAMYWDDFSPGKLDAAAIKRIVSMSVATKRLPYERRSKNILMTYVLYASTNHHTMLVDYTGNRRFYPLEMVANKLHGKKQIDDYQLCYDLADYYYNLVLYELIENHENQGNLDTYYKKLMGEKEAIVEEARNSGYFEQYTNYHEHINQLDEYFEDVQAYHLMGKDMLMSGEWDEDKHIIARLRQRKTDKYYCSPAEFKKYCEAKNYLNSQITSLSSGAFKERAKHYGYDISKCESKYVAAYRGSIRMYELPPITLIKQQRELLLENADNQKNESDSVESIDNLSKNDYNLGISDSKKPVDNRYDDIGDDSGGSQSP